MRAFTFAFLFFLLGCGGMIGSFVPEIPVTLPGDARTFVGKTSDEGDQSRTRVSGISPSTPAPELEQMFREELTADGWAIEQSLDNGAPILLSGTRGAETLTITLESEDEGCRYEVVWMQER